jgi:hypothetical protein
MISMLVFTSDIRWHFPHEWRTLICSTASRLYVAGSDGETRIATPRRLGDRWYENEMCTDKEGKRRESKTWHDVRDEDIAGFKLEWNHEQSGIAKFET